MVRVYSHEDNELGCPKRSRDEVTVTIGVWRSKTCEVFQLESYDQVQQKKKRKREKERKNTYTKEEKISHKKEGMKVTQRVNRNA